MTTIPSRIGPVLDRSVDAATPRVGAEPHRVESFAVGGQPVHSSVGARLVADGVPDGILASAGESTDGPGGLHR